MKNNELHHADAFLISILSAVPKKHRKEAFDKFCVLAHKLDGIKKENMMLSSAGKKLLKRMLKGEI